MKHIYSLIIVICLVVSLPPHVRADERGAEKYQECMSLVDSNAEAAVKYANDWIFGGTNDGAGSVPAGHCKALGYLAMGKAVEAAELLEKLVEDVIIQAEFDPDPGAVRKNARLRVQLYVQAALAWKEAGKRDQSNYDNAYMAYSSALSGIKKDDPRSRNTGLLRELYLERGTLQILRGQYKAAVEDLTRAIDLDDRQFEGFLQRAKAYRKRGDYLKARLDLKVAFILQADHPDILLESGILYREAGKKLEARRDWQKIIELYPQSEYADLARENIDLLKLS